MSSSPHIFAVYYLEIDNFVISLQEGAESTLKITQYKHKDLIHRLTRVIRLRPKEKIILFGKRYACEAILQESTTTHIALDIVHWDPIKPLEPIINLCIPLLDKSALEQSVYAATALGVYKIILLPATKEKRHTLSPSELERYARIMIAAAEQSKQLHLPQLQLIQQWDQLPASSHIVLADIEGISFSDCLKKYASGKQYTIVIGPSGGFTDQEKEQLLNQGAIKGKLGPTVLRSEDAVMVGLGIVRSLLNT